MAGIFTFRQAAAAGDTFTDAGASDVIVNLIDGPSNRAILSGFSSSVAGAAASAAKMRVTPSAVSVAGILSATSIGVGTLTPQSALDVTGGTTLRGALSVTGALNVAGQAIVGAGGVKNRLLNGGMRIDQRNCGALVTPPSGQTSLYYLDRWMVATSTSNCTIQQVALAPTSFSNSICITKTSTGLIYMQQWIPASLILDFNMGAVSGVACPIVLSMWVMSGAVATIAVSLNNNNLASPAQFVSNFVIAAANTWQRVVFLVPPCSMGAWSNVSGAVLLLTISLGSDQIAVPVASAWTTGAQVFATAASIAQPLPIGASLNVTGVQLELGVAATGFDLQPTDIETDRCCRYYQKSYDYANRPGTVSAMSDMLAFNCVTTDPLIANNASIRLSATLRAAGVCTLYSPVTGALNAMAVASHLSGALSSIDSLTGLTVSCSTNNIQLGYSGGLPAVPGSCLMWVHYTVSAEIGPPQFVVYIITPPTLTNNSFSIDLSTLFSGATSYSASSTKSNTTMSSSVLTVQGAYRGGTWPQTVSYNVTSTATNVYGSISIITTFVETASPPQIKININAPALQNTSYSIDLSTIFSGAASYSCSSPYNNTTITNTSFLNIFGNSRWTSYPIVVTATNPIGSTVQTTTVIEMLSGLSWGRFDQGYFADSPAFFGGILFSASGFTSGWLGVSQTTGTQPAGYLPISQNSQFSFLISGFFIPKVTGTHVLSMASDDASYLWLGPNALGLATSLSLSNASISLPGTHGVIPGSTSVSMVAGTAYPLFIMYGQGGGGYNLQLTYTPPGGNSTSDGTQVFYSSQPSVYQAAPPIPSIVPTLNVGSLTDNLFRVDLTPYFSGATSYSCISDATNTSFDANTSSILQIQGNRRGSNTSLLRYWIAIKAMNVYGYIILKTSVSEYGYLPAQSNTNLLLNLGKLRNNTNVDLSQVFSGASTYACSSPSYSNTPVSGSTLTIQTYLRWTTYTITAYATNNNGTTSLNADITEYGPPPQTLRNIEDQTLAANNVYITVSNYFSGSSLSYSLPGDNHGIAYSMNNNNLTINGGAYRNTDYYITVRATNDNGYADTNVHIFEPTRPNPKPVQTNTINSPHVTNNTLQFDLTQYFSGAQSFSTSSPNSQSWIEGNNLMVRGYGGLYGNYSITVTATNGYGSINQSPNPQIYEDNAPSFPYSQGNPFKFDCGNGYNDSGPGSVSYGGTEMSIGGISLNGGRQSWTVQTPGVYHFQLTGAGGYQAYGRVVTTQFNLRPHDQVTLTVGQPGGSRGGHGGTFVSSSEKGLLAAAGGAGGRSGNPSGTVWANGLSAANSGNGGDGNPGGSGYRNGWGGFAGVSAPGGGGYSQDGSLNQYNGTHIIRDTGTTAGSSFTNGSRGGTSPNWGPGGFGGGGAGGGGDGGTGNNEGGGGGGGGGYSGGGGGDAKGGGGGGGSTGQDMGNANTYNGSVTVWWSSS